VLLTTTDRLQIKKAEANKETEDLSYQPRDLYLSYGLSCRQHMHVYTYTYITAFWNENSQQKLDPSQEFFRYMLGEGHCNTDHIILKFGIL